MRKFVLSRNGLVIGAVIILAILIWRQVQPGAAADAPVCVTTVTAGIENLPDTLTVSGTITPVDEVALDVTEPGTLANVYVKVGEHVTRGEILASLDDGELAADAAAAQAQLREAQANGAASARAFDRAASIRDSGAISPEVVDQRGAEAAAQAGQVGAARADLAAARTRLEAASVVAPVDGVIAAEAAEPGQYAAPGGPALFTLVGDTGFEFVAPVPQDDVALVKAGMKARISLAGGDVTGTVVGADPRIDPVTHLGTMRVALPGDAGLIAGDFVAAVVDLGPAKSLAVPQSALVADEAGFHVMVVRNGVALARPVTLAEVAGDTGGLAPIAAGIAAGDVVVAQNGAALHDGQTVRLAN